YDMWSNDIRREAMQLAMDTGEAACSGKITLVQETDENVQSGFLTYLPVYRTGEAIDTVEERRHACYGWVYSPFRAGDLLSGILGSNDPHYRLRIYDGEAVNPSALLYDSAGTVELERRWDDEKDRHKGTTQLSIQGRSWLLQVDSTAFQGSGQSSLPRMVAGGGLIIDVLLFYVIWSIQRLQSRAQSLATEMTKELEESTRELRQFAYAATHDVKAPLNNIGNALILLREEPLILSEQSQQAMSWIELAQARAVEILDQLMEVVHLKEKGRQPAETFDVAAEVRRAAASFEEELSTHRVQIDISRCVGVLSFPKSVFARLTHNLISNAIKYRMLERPLVIEIEFERGRQQSVLRVRDNGLGFDSAKDGDKIFGLFRRAHSHVAGSGFGLYITKQSLELHGASIECSASPGDGCEFMVTFPCEHA
ncbi:MAG: CHASE domain-containing protein, partial [Verrucomicrobiae bacterium]|nr:CHASE domain-containing protein [Verrucomicrobiae bacterium]